MDGASLAVQRLSLHASTTKGSVSIPVWGTKIPHAAWWGKKKKKWVGWNLPLGENICLTLNFETYSGYIKIEMCICKCMCRNLRVYQCVGSGEYVDFYLVHLSVWCVCFGCMICKDICEWVCHFMCLYAYMWSDVKCINENLHLAGICIRGHL